ncbi:GerAB/ArcD/ProY family transporter [Peribacillus asahii]|uniref:GerAB/ArcD/ProY family transporter n=1 Tax=Peribacillus asahii TaxID=228899 RepID=UPI00207A1A98|nr:GerAB/ArcD/ProY family transporter [Peribacillus asahii]USK69774.1 spore germination protein [Peribacillus asahii]
MEKAKISAYQLFVLMVLFEHGTTLLIPLAVEAKQDAWLAILLGTIGGFVLFLIYYGLYQYYPDILPTEYVQKLTGKVFGRLLAFFFLIYFMYIAARDLRDFGEMLVTVAYPDTPLFIVNALLILVIIYTVRKGIEVLVRTGELFFIFVYLLAITGFILIFASGLFDFTNLKPVLEEGISSVVKITFTQTLYFPFGEVVVFAMILPYVNQSKKMKVTGLFAMGLSGINMAIITALNISVLGVDLVSRSQFPLLSTIQTIRVAEFLERLDVYFMLASIICGFFKISVYCYAAVIGIADLFNVKESSQLVYPIGIVILFFSITISSNFSEHIQEGSHIVPFFVHLPLQVVIPLLLLVIAFFKNRKNR